MISGQLYSSTSKSSDGCQFPSPAAQRRTDSKLPLALRSHTELSSNVAFSTNEGLGSTLRSVSRGTSPRGFEQSSTQSTSKPSKQHKAFPNGHSYVGTWSDGRMHGEGLYVWQDGSEYTGEFQNNSMSGRGEKRWPCGRCYRGEWKQDMMWGDGEMTWPTGESYTGQFWKGAYHGRGTRVKPSGDKYVGEFSHGEQEGKGSFWNATEGWSFVGLWLHGRMYGEGRIEWPDGTAYVGEWQDGIRDGHGKLTWPDGSWYEGPFRGNNVEGQGRKAFPDGSWFDGQFQDGEFDGQGIFHWSDGTEFEGLWSRSEIVGPGCHRFPNGTTITGTFLDQGASGEGTKQWPNGCVYIGILNQNRIAEHGTLKWPDGRCYVGNFHDDAMHGNGTLVWSDKLGTCTYKGQFGKNAFEGKGVLEWSSGSRYEGTFHSGLYHGEGSFEWPGQHSVYRGQWILGEMCGRGTLTCSGMDGESGYVYVGNFKQGHMQGKGHIAFNLPSGEKDEYHGIFKASKFNGRGTFKWASCASLTGLFEDNYCNRIGRKLYPDGRAYTGELRFDLEHGKGVETDPQRKRIVGIWNNGKLEEELFDGCAPELDLNLEPCGSSSSEEDNGAESKIEEIPVPAKRLSRRPTVDLSSRVVSRQGSRRQTLEVPLSSCNEPILHKKAPKRCANLRPLLPVSDENGQPVTGKTIVTFLNGDKYVGYMKNGRKHGRGMYVYADLTMYRGLWREDVLEGIRHPVTEDPLPVKVKKMTCNLHQRRIPTPVID